MHVWLPAACLVTLVPGRKYEFETLGPTILPPACLTCVPVRKRLKEFAASLQPSPGMAAPSSAKSVRVDRLPWVYSELPALKVSGTFDRRRLS